MKDKELMQQALEAAYLAGFNASCAGYNGEYPFSGFDKPEQNATWIKDRDNALRDRLAQPYKGIADHTNQVTNGRMRIDPVTGDVGIGAPSSQPEPVNKYCCHLCFNRSGQMFLDRMILCLECGNKRCPKATHHELQCTKSNDPAPQPAQEQPGQQGWQSVPMEPTIEMIAALGFGGDIDMGIGHAAISKEIENAYTAMLAVAPQPAQRKPLTDEEIDSIYTGVRAIHHEIDSYVFARAIEATHGIKENT